MTTIRKIKTALRERVLDAIDEGSELTKKEMMSYVNRRLNALSFDKLREFAAKRVVAECVGQIKQSRRHGWSVNGRDVTDMPHNVDGKMVPEAMLLKDQAEAVLNRNEVNILGRLSEHALLTKRIEKLHTLPKETVRKRRKLEAMIFELSDA